MNLVINIRGWGVIIYVMLLALFYGVPLWAIVIAARRLRGSLRIFWIVAIVIATLTWSLFGLLVAVVFLAFRRRFVAIQRKNVSRIGESRIGTYA